MVKNCRIHQVPAREPRRILRDGSEITSLQRAEMFHPQGYLPVKAYCPVSNTYLTLLRTRHGVAAIIPRDESLLTVDDALQLTADGSILMLAQPMRFVRRGEA